MWKQVKLLYLPSWGETKDTDSVSLRDARSTITPHLWSLWLRMVEYFSNIAWTNYAWAQNPFKWSNEYLPEEPYGIERLSLKLNHCLIQMEFESRNLSPFLTAYNKNFHWLVHIKQKLCHLDQYICVRQDFRLSWTSASRTTTNWTLKMVSDVPHQISAHSRNYN